MEQVERLVKQEQDAGNAGGSEQVIGATDQEGNDKERHHDQGPKGRRPHPDHFSVQIDQGDRQARTDRCWHPKPPAQ